MQVVSDITLPIVVIQHIDCNFVCEFGYVLCLKFL